MEARKAMLKEVAQINEKEVFSPIKASSLTPTQRRKALRTINLIKEKRDGVLKGRTCVDGRPQRAYIAKEDASSPTMLLDYNLRKQWLHLFKFINIIIKEYLLLD